MLPIVLRVQLSASDDNGIAESQTPSGAGNLTLNGALVSGGVATLTDAGQARQVLITTTANETAKTLTIYGTDANGVEINETVTGPNNTTGTTTQFFRTVTRIAVSAAFTGAVYVGTNGVGCSRPAYLDQWAAGTVALQADVSGTVNFTVQQTVDNLNNTSASSISWVNHPDVAMAAATATAQANYAYAPSFVRLKVNSGTGSAQLTIRQSQF